MATGLLLELIEGDAGIWFNLQIMSGTSDVEGEEGKGGVTVIFQIFDSGNCKR